MSISDTGRLFLENTQLKNLGPLPQMNDVPQPALEYPLEQTLPPIELTQPVNLNFGKVEFKQLVDGRRTLRKYSLTALTIDELAYLLWSTQGVQSKTETSTHRVVPSAGARHALETYILVNRVEGLTPGVYRYLALEHQLIAIDLSEGISEKLVEASRQKFISNAAVCFMWVAITERMTWRYGDRGYRYLFLDAGHVCQNLYLSAEAIHCGACAINAYQDDAMNQLLKLNGEDQFLIYMASVGKRD